MSGAPPPLVPRVTLGTRFWLHRHPRLVAGALIVLAAFLGWEGYQGGRYLWARAHLQAARQALEQHAWADAQKHLEVCLRMAR